MFWLDEMTGRGGLSLGWFELQSSSFLRTSQRLEEVTKKISPTALTDRNN